MTLLERVARALHAAHETGRVHLDVKPGNVMVTLHGEPVSLDFGLARASGEASDLTLSGAPLGTPAYMSPEQIAGRPAAIDRSSDVWSLVVTAYECLTLATPFRAETREALYRRILEDAAPARHLIPSLPRAPELLVARIDAQRTDVRAHDAIGRIHAANGRVAEAQASFAAAADVLHKALDACSALDGSRNATMNFATLRPVCRDSWVGTAPEIAIATHQLEITGSRANPIWAITAQSRQASMRRRVTRPPGGETRLSAAQQACRSRRRARGPWSHPIRRCGQ